MKRLAVLISGRGRNLEAIIRHCRAGHIPAELALVISNRADAGGLLTARAAGIATQVIAHDGYASRVDFDAALATALDSVAPDAVALAGFMRILTPAFIAQFQGRLLNIHPSLLPEYPGLHTHRRVLEDGQRRHGATVHFVSDALDGGPAVLQGGVAVTPEDTEQTLAMRVLQQVELKIFPQALSWLLRGDLQLRGAQVLFRGQALAAPLRLDDLEDEFC